MTSLLERLDIIPKEVRIQRANAWESVVLIEKLCPQLQHKGVDFCTGSLSRLLNGKRNSSHGNGTIPKLLDTVGWECGATLRVKLTKEDTDHLPSGLEIMPHDQRCTQAMSTRMGITSTLLYESVEFRGKGICLPLVPKKRMTLREGQESLAFLLESIMEDLHRKRAEWIGIQDKARAQYLEGAVQTHTDAPETIHAVVDNLVSVAREDPRYANSPIIVLGQTKGRKRAETQTVFPLLTNVDLWAIDDAVIIGLRASNLPSTPSWSFSKTAADPWGKLEIGSEHEGFSVVLRGSPLQLRRWGEEELEETDVAERKFSEFLADGEDGHEPGFFGDRDNSYALLYASHCHTLQEASKNP